MTGTAWMLWMQGWQNAPPVAKAARSRFEAMNPEWELVLLDADSLVDALPESSHWILDRAEEIPHAALSDLVRIALLNSHGGVWIDATVLCMRPLDEWLPTVIDAGFFAFADPGPGRPLSSWFLFSEPGHPLTDAWADRCQSYWEGRSGTEDYHWFHHLFGELIASDAAAASAWHTTSKLPADGPHHFLPFVRRHAADPTASDISVFAGDVTPVIKLNRRFELEHRHTDSSNYATLLRTSDAHLMNAAPTGREPVIGETSLSGAVDSRRARIIRGAIERLGRGIITNSTSLPSTNGAVTIHLPNSTSVTVGPGRDLGATTSATAERNLRIGIGSGHVRHDEPGERDDDPTIEVLFSMLDRLRRAST